MKHRTRKTRIVATVGPATSSATMLRKLVRAGVDVFRLNFSHGDEEFFRAVVADIRRVAAELDEHVAILQDLSGPKMRVGRMQDDAVRLRNGKSVEVVEGHGVGTEACLYVEAAGAIKRLKKGSVIRLADGLLELRVTARRGAGVIAQVVTGGVLRSRQGVNIPGSDLGVKALTRKDKRDMKLGVELGVDAVALSFVQDASDVMSLRRLLEKHGSSAFVIAKIERAEALQNLDAIMDVASGVMVARGDLGVEIGVERVPLAQKRIIRRALERRVPVITATQMLESMIERPTPTRAEVSDIANAVLEGTDALMLSGETAVGLHPVKAVGVLHDVASETEREPAFYPEWEGNAFLVEDPAQAVTRAARVAARSSGARAVLAFTNSGRTARLVSSQRTARDCYGFSPNDTSLRRMKFFWGVHPLEIGKARSVDAMIHEAETLLRKRRLVKKGDRMVIICGEQVSTGATNSLHIHTVGEA
ncbi:MAG: pyruvate kinase [Planctomycetota bacterium]|nr:MAG: pyruvate kinase [Planctomycetota bacterium]